MSLNEVKAFADREGVRGPGVSIAWADRGIDPAAKAGKVKWVLETPFPDFRRLDPLARFCCLAVEALGADFVENTALVLDSTYGCLHADRKFQASLATIASAAPRGKSGSLAGCARSRRPTRSGVA